MKWTREKGDWQCGVGQVVISGRVGLGEGVELNYPASDEGKYRVRIGVSVLYSSFLLLTGAEF
jgi:hypothetical protein